MDTLRTPSVPRPRLSSSWIDALTTAIDRTRLPNPAAYGLALLAAILAAQAVKWVDGSAPRWSLSSIAILMGVWLVLPLALMHYLDRVAHAALDSFRPVIEGNEASLERWHRELTTMPAGPLLVANAAGLVSLWLAMWASPALFSVARTSLATAIVWFTILHLNFALVGGLVYHTIRQLHLVSRIYASANRLDVLRPEPLYAFAGLTARTGIAWALALYLSVVLRPEIMASTYTAALFAGQVALIVAMFFLPLLGIHSRLTREKRNLQAGIHQRLQAVFAELHAAIDGLDRASIDAVNKMITGLTMERDIVNKVPTWPWQPGTLTAVITTLLIPVGLYLVQHVLTRVLGF